jgi:hypothetical protein
VLDDLTGAVRGHDPESCPVAVSNQASMRTVTIAHLQKRSNRTPFDGVVRADQKSGARTGKLRGIEGERM